MTLFEQVQSQREDILGWLLTGAHATCVYSARWRAMRPGRSLLDLGGLLMDLQKLMGRKVDVVTETGLRPRLRPRILREARPL